MLNQRSLQVTAASRLGDHFILPAYNSYCFAHIPDTVRQCFGLAAAQPLPADVLPGANRYQQVVFFFIDAFGWRFVQKYLKDYPFLARFMQQGVVSQITSMFPSTTSAHTTCIHTGLSLAESGVYEWYYYEPAVDMLVSPLLYSIPGIGKRDWLAERGVTPNLLFPDQTLYLELQAQGIRSTVFQPRDYARSVFSSYVCRGAEMMPFISWTEALTNLAALLKRKQGPAYYFLYLDVIDSLMHVYGPDSRQVEAEIRTFLAVMERFAEAIAGQVGDTLLLLSADHGQADISPATTLYLNRLAPDFEKYLKVNRVGQPLWLGGSARDLFLYVREEALSEVEALLAAPLKGRAEVYRTAELVEKGVFGPAPGARFLERVGNLVVLSYNGSGVFLYQPGKFEQKYYGHHGGLSPEEMLVPFLALEI